MTLEEIEKALLTEGRVVINHEKKSSIVLSEPGSQRLAKVVFDRVRSSNVDDLARSENFFRTLESVFCEDSNKSQPNSEIEEEIGKAEEKPGKRNWRLKKIETKGFGGLNATHEDLFEFDISCQDYCIEGQNGSGKSSLTNAVLFAMTGKIHRDQLGICSEPGRSENVLSEDGGKLGNWPPFAVYPRNWPHSNSPADISVTLTFGNEKDDEEIVASRRLRGSPENLKEEESVDPRLITVPALIEASLLMPMRIQHIRVPQAADNDQLVGLIRQLIGLEPLLDVAELVKKLCHRGQRFLKFAQDQNVNVKAREIERNLNEAKEKIAELEPELDLSIAISSDMPISEGQLTRLDETKRKLVNLQAEGFAELSELAFEGFDPNNGMHRDRVADAVKKLKIEADRQKSGQGLPPVLKGMSGLAKAVESQEIELLKSALVKASSDLERAVIWSKKQKRDTKLRLKAVAAAHFEDFDELHCPLCEQSIGGEQHRNLVEDLRELKTSAEEAETLLDDSCLRIERNVKNVAEKLVPSQFIQIGRFSVKRNFQHHAKRIFVDADYSANDLPGFARAASDLIDAAFYNVEELEFGSDLPESDDSDAVTRVKRMLDHFNEIVKGAEKWPQCRQNFVNSWQLLFSKDKQQSLISKTHDLEKKIQSLEPFGIASKKIGNARSTANDYNAIVKRQAQRETIVKALGPLRGLRDLVNLAASMTIDHVSNTAKEIHQKIYNPEALAYEKTEISEFRGKQSLSFRAKLGEEANWRIDASLLANTSWMRGILWSFLFAIRERAIDQAGYCPFELLVLDDPQITFDTRNLKGWVEFLGKEGRIRAKHPCQLLATTHSAQFALEISAMPDFRNAAIETGRPWSKPVQIVEGDFATVRFNRMIDENSDDRARTLIADIRVLAETLLKHALEQLEPGFIRRSETTLGKIFGLIDCRIKTNQAPYTNKEFVNLINAKTSNTKLFRQLSEPHHSASETITVREAEHVYKYWQETLFPAICQVWQEYRFLQKSIIGEIASISLPSNCNHEPICSTALKTAQPRILGRVSAFSDGRAANAIQIDHIGDNEIIDLRGRASYRLEKDTLSPLASIGDILITRLDNQYRARNLIVEDRGTHLVARRWLEDDQSPALAVLTPSSSNPREALPVIISRAQGANRRKIVGVLFAADQHVDKANPDRNAEATLLEADNRVVANILAETQVFEVQGSSAEPLALDKQFILAKPQAKDLHMACRELDGKPVIVEDSEHCAFFKRLRTVNSKLVCLESLDKTGSEGLVTLSTCNSSSDPYVTSIREVVGVIFDKD